MQKSRVKDAKGRRFLIAEGAIVVALILFIVLTRLGGTASDVSIDSIRAAMDERVAGAELLIGDANDIREGFALDEAVYGEAYYRFSESGLDARQLLIVKCSDESALDAAYEKVNKYNDSQMKVFRDYSPEQYSLLKKSVLWTRGSYLFYAVSESAGEWEEAFESLIR